MIKLHEKALDFTLKGSDKNNHSLSDYLGKNVILYFYPNFPAIKPVVQAACKL